MDLLSLINVMSDGFPGIGTGVADRPLDLPTREAPGARGDQLHSSGLPVGVDQQQRIIRPTSPQRFDFSEGHP